MKFNDIKDNLQYWARIAGLVGRRILADKYTYRASALTYTTLLALVPLVTVTFSILSAFPVFDQYGQAIQDFIFSNFVPASGEAIQTYLVTFVEQTRQLSAVGMVILIVTAVMLLLTIENSLNDIWRVRVGRHGVSALLRYWAVLSLSPIFIGLSFVVTSYIFSLPFVSTATSHFNIQKFLLTCLPFLLVFLGFALLYIVVPNCRVKVRDGMIGALVATLLFEGAKSGFALYVVNFPTYKLVYGAFAVVPIFLVWVYLSWVIILIGASVSHTVSTVQRKGKGAPVDGFSHAYLWLQLLWQAQKTGAELTLSECLKKAPWYYQQDPEWLLQTLVAKGFVKETQSGGYVLARSCDQLTLKELYDTLPWTLPRPVDLDALAGKGADHYVEAIKRANVCLTDALNVSLESLYA